MKEIILLINYNQLNFNEILRIDVIGDGVHGQGAFRFPTKLLFVMKTSKNVERSNSIAYMLCKKDKGYILKNTIIDKLQNSFKLILDPFKIDNH